MPRSVNNVASGAGLTADQAAEITANTTTRAQVTNNQTVLHRC